MESAYGGSSGGGVQPAATAADAGGAAADGGAGTKKKRRSGPRSRSSPYTGVTQYKRTGNWEAHIWVQNPRGKGHQRHLGSYLTAEDAARCYDRAVLKLRGEAAETNFPREEYAEDEFLLANERTERDRFLDLLRQRFALKSNAAPPSSGPTRSQPPRPKRKRSPGETANGSEGRVFPESPRFRTVVRAPRSSPMGMASMAAVSAAFPGGSPHRVTVHQWPGGGHPPLGLRSGPHTSPALTSPLPQQALRHSDSPQGRGGGFGGGGGYAGSFGAGGSSGLLRHDSVGAASEEPLLITTTAPASSAQMRESLLWPSLPIPSAPTAGGMPLPGPLSPLSSLPLGPSSLPPTPLLHLGQLSPAQPQLGSLLGGAMGSALSPLRPLGVLSTLSLPGSRAATPQASPSRFGSPPPAHLPAIPSFGDLAGQLAPALRRPSSGGEGAAASAGAAVLGGLAGIQAQLSALEAPGAPPALAGPSLRSEAGTSAAMTAPAGMASFNLNLLSFPPLPLVGRGGSGAPQPESGSQPAFAFPSFGQGSSITGSMLQAASAAAAAGGAGGADQPAIAAPAGGSQGASQAVSAGLASLLGGQGGTSLGRWWQPASPACSEGQSQDWLAASLPMADPGAGGAFLNST